MGADRALSFVVRPEAEPDHEAIRAVNEAAFGRLLEARIADALRSNGKVLLSHVAVVEGRVAGHAMYSRATIEGESGRRVEAALGPLAVAPALQGRGIGSALVREGIEACRRLGYGALFLLGSPAYYRRFGFVPASRYGLRYATAIAYEDAFQALELVPGALAGTGGFVSEEPEFEMAE